VSNRPAQRVPGYLRHSLDAIDRATGYVAGMDFQGFERDTRTQDAVIRSIEFMGEAAKKVRAADASFAANHPHVPWEVMYGMRDRIVHDYFEVDLEVAWRTVQVELPSLRQQVAALLVQFPNQ